MPLSEATISYDLADLTGVDFDARRTKVWASTNVPGDAVIDTDGNKIRLGAGSGTVSADGTGSIAVWIPGAGSNPASWQTYIHVDYPDRQATGGRGKRTFGPFTITAGANLADLVDEQEVPPTYLTALTQELDGYATDAANSAAVAQSAADLATTIIGLDTSDEAVAVLVPDVGSQTGAALSAMYGLAGGAETFVAKDDMKASGLVVAAAGDSTGDEIAEYLWRGVAQWVGERPDLTAVGYHTYGESGPYTGPTDIQVSAGGYWSPYYRDEFNRTGELVGSTPDVGLPYGGTAGMWIMDGTEADCGGSSGSAAQDSDYTIPGGRRKVTMDIAFNTTPGATEKTLSVFIGQNTSNRVQLRLSVSTGGVQAWILNKVIGGVSTLLATGSGSPLAASSVNDVTISLEMNPDGTITGKVGASTVTGTLSGAEADAVVDLGARVWFQTSNTASVGSISIKRAQADKFVTSSRTLTFYNGSRAGSVAQYAIDRLASLYPVPVDVLFVNYGHNYGSGGSPAAFLTAIDALCSAFKEAHPEAGIVICSQNPEFSPAGSITAHLNRNAALRRYAATKGYGYLPVHELYASQSDKGASWVQSDGVHPKRSTDTADPANGSYQSAVLLRNYLNNLSLRTD